MDWCSICPVRDITSPTPNPEPSQPPPTHGTEQTPEPNADSKPKPVMMHEPVKRTELIIAPEPEPHRESDQVREPATPCIAVGLLVEYMRAWRKAPPKFPQLRVNCSWPLRCLRKWKRMFPWFSIILLVPPSSKCPVSPLAPPSLKSLVSP